MHLKSITLSGFKSFPDRTRLEFGPGVSVIVGPNGSGKSNITDAVLWALGEQSPLAVRGQAMQDVIFGGARGQQARRAADVELVIDTQGAGARESGAETPFAEVSIRRRLDRSGEGEYRLNGARCRLVDVLEVLSDTGLGKEMHSVVSQGRVESVVASKPQERRLLIEEAAGLGKHRKRRRRAQLKLARTQENLDRSLDVEREARSRLRPLKRQAEAAELHARLERQSLEARWELARDGARTQGAALAEAELAVATARAARDEADAALAAVGVRREAAERALAAGGERRDALSARRYATRSAGERVELRLEQARSVAHAADGRAQTGAVRLRQAEAAAREAESMPDGPVAGRLEELTEQIAELDRQRGAQLDDQRAELEARRAAADAECARLESVASERREAVVAADEHRRRARVARREAEAEVERAARERSRVAAQVATIDEFLRARGGDAADHGGVALADGIDAEPGCELALAAVLAGRLGAAVVPDRRTGGEVLDRAGADGGQALVADVQRSDVDGAPPLAGAQPLAAFLRGTGPARAVAERMVAGAWLVDDLDQVPAGFDGIAVTRAGRAWFAAAGELRQAPAGGEERVLAERNRRVALTAREEELVRAERAATELARAATARVEEADAARTAAESKLDQALRDRDGAAQERHHAGWLIDQRASAPDQGPVTRRRAELAAALAAERRLAEQAESLRSQSAERVMAERARLEHARTLAPRAERLAGVLVQVGQAIADRVSALDGELEADRAAGEGVAAQLRSCAHEEVQLQAQLRERGEEVTAVEVAAQQVRDRVVEVRAELTDLAGRLELAGEPAAEALGDDQRQALEQRIVRLAGRRERLGPVNPLAKGEYAEALAHVEELESQRGDLETALRELATLIADTDRRIREAFEETFAAAARNFEELVGQLFPGGRGRLRLVREDERPARVLGGQSATDAGADDDAAEDDDTDAEDSLGVEIEMTPAGKSMKRLSLLSGGEKSLTALAFLFAIFLARPCPFYVLDEVEAALDDLNIDRFLRLLRRYSERAQFIVVTHQKRTMEAADTLYGVSMGDDGISKVISRRLPREGAVAADAA